MLEVNISYNENYHEYEEDIKLFNKIKLGLDVPVNKTCLGLKEEIILPNNNNMYQLCETIEKNSFLLKSNITALYQQKQFMKKQLEDISIRPTGNGGYTFYTESQQHDDWVDSELLALMACDPPGSESGDYGFGRPIRGMTPIRPIPVKRPSNFIQKVRERKRKKFLDNLPDEVREEILTG